MNPVVFVNASHAETVLKVCLFIFIYFLLLFCTIAKLQKCCYMCSCLLDQGLYIQSKCTTISDTICDVLDGYHCTHFSDSQCSRALKHSVCAPGQETKTPGIVFECLKID